MIALVDADIIGYRIAFACKDESITTDKFTLNSYIADNIIQLNYNPNNPYSGAGISSALGYQAGIEIGRGSLDWAEMVFSEQANHYDTATLSTVTGTFQLKTRNTSTNSTALSGLQVRTITNDGVADLAFDLQGASPVLKIVNSVNYESRVTDPNHIPNKKFVNDYVSASNGVANVTNIHYPVTGTENSRTFSFKKYEIFFNPLLRKITLKPFVIKRKEVNNNSSISRLFISRALLQT
jgi:hypothetical protein